jgi:DNA-binding transcriptional ArsR family regulator
MEPDPAPQAPIKVEDLPSQLTAQLSARTRDALGHPLRRQILRTLNASASARGPGELAAAALPQTSLSVIGYHAQVLESCGAIALAGLSDHGGVSPLYASRVAADEGVAAVLQATSGRDRAADPR